MKLNLGCGNDIRGGDCINLDVTKHRDGIQIVHDLNVLPYPFDDNQFSMVYAISVLEHLELTLIQSLDEIWRITAPAGECVLKYPLANSPTIHDDPTHRWFWSMSAIDYVDPNTAYGIAYGFYTQRKWQIIERKLHKNLSCWAVLKKVV